MPEIRDFFSNVQDNTIYSGLKELYILIKEAGSSHPTVSKLVAALLALGVVHDILTWLYTVKIWGSNDAGEPVCLGEAMLRRGLDGYRLRIPPEALLKTDIPLYRLEYSPLLLTGVRNARITVECEGFKRQMLIHEGVDFVI